MDDGPAGSRAHIGSILERERHELTERARFGAKKAVRGVGGMAITSHPLATRVAVDVLRAGGNAADAALAASITQTVVEPHMTTITGMLSMLYRDGATGTLSYVNGCVNAPLSPLPGFRHEDVRTGRGVAVPGFWAAFEAAADRLGSWPRAALMAPAIELARDGFEVHPFLFGDIYASLDRLGRSDQGREIYFPDRAMLQPGEVIRQRRAADTLERLAADGGDYFYRGEFAQRFCDVVAAAGGVITRADLEAYEARWQEPIRGTYRGHEILASPPPDTGGSHLIEALNMVELLDLPRLGHPTESVEALVQLMLIVETVKAEGARMNDPQSHPLPLATLLSKDYAAMRLELAQMRAGVRPSGRDAPPGSNHVTVVDGHGSIASVLHSCLCDFGDNGLFVEGVSVCAAGGHFLRTMPQPGRRASVYVAPNILLQDGRPVLTSGSPSSCLLANIVQNTVNLVDYGLGLEESVHLPRFGNAHETGQLIESDLNSPAHEELQARGLQPELVSPWHYLMGSFEGVVIGADGVLSACPDPRRTGAAEAVAPPAPD